MLLLLLACRAPIAPTPAPLTPADLLGRWEHASGGEEWIELDDRIVGVGFFVEDGVTVMVEALSLGPVEGQLTYTVLPGGERRVDFPQSGEGLVFENPANGYPTRIAYVRTDNGLEATISGPDAPAHTFALRPTPRQPASGLEGLDRAFGEALTSGGAAAWGSRFAPDGVQWVDSGPVRGPEANAARVAPALEDTVFQWRPLASGLSPAADAGFTAGELIITDRRDAQWPLTGHYMNVWRLQSDGSWKLWLSTDIPFRAQQL